jgi:hypothetical protein
MRKNLIQPTASADETRCDHPVTESLNEMVERLAEDIAEETQFQTELTDQDRAALFLRCIVALRSAAQAVRLAVIEECAKVVDRSAENSDWGHSRETMMAMLFRKQAQALRDLK